MIRCFGRLRWGLVARTILVVATAIAPFGSLSAAGPVSFTLSPTRNQTSVGTAINIIAPLSNSSLQTIFDALGMESQIQQQQSLNQLSGELYGTTQTIGLLSGEQFLQRVSGRMVSNGQFLAGRSFGNPSSDQLDGPSEDEDAEIRGQLSGESRNYWSQGFGAGGNLESDGNGAGVRVSQGGGVYGMDFGGDESGVIGFAGGNSYAGFHDGFSSGGQLISSQIGLYALKQNEVAYTMAALDYGFEHFDVSRNAAIGGINQTDRGHYNGHQFGAYVEAGMKLHAGWVHFQPLMGLQNLYLAQQGLSESGGPAALNVSAAQADSLRTNMGARLVIDQITGIWGETWTPYWHGRWVTEVLENDRTVTASFHGAPLGGAFTSHGTRLGHDFFVYGKGIQVQLNEQWSLFGSAELTTFGRIHNETGSFGALYRW